MKKARFTVVDQPQLAIAKSEGLRYIEHKAKIGCLYYCHAEPFSYCVQNVRGQEKQAVAEEVMGHTGGIGLYGWGIHVDTRPGYARWNG